MAPSKCKFVSILLLHMAVIFSNAEGDDVVSAPEMTKDAFEAKVDTGDFLLVNFGGPGCRNCKDFAPIFNEVHTQLLNEKSDVTAAVVNNMDIVRHYDFQKLPALVLFRKNVPILYEGHHEVEEIQAWLDVNREIHGRYLNDDDFEHLTQASTGSTTGDWLVQFCDPERPQCVALITTWETVAYRLKGRINVATVDITKNKALAKRFKIMIDKTPTVILFHQGKQFPYGLFHFGIASLAHFAEKSYKHVQGTIVQPPPAPFIKDGKMYKVHLRMINGPADWLDKWLAAGHRTNKVWDVPREATALDELTDSIANKLKAVQPGGKGTFVVIVGGLIVFAVVLFKIFGKQSTSGAGSGGGPKKGV